jgi:Tol biopolymer transport system component
MKNRQTLQVLALAFVLGSTGWAQVTQRVSVDSGGAEGNGDSGYDGLSISADGRYVAFASIASNLVPGDTNGFIDAFVRDRQSGTTERVSISSGGVQGDGDSYYPSISADGRYVAFESFADNLVAAGDTNGSWDVFIRDRLSGTTERVSLDSGGAQGNNGSYAPSISSDGRYVAFHSYASNLVLGDTNGVLDAFVRDLQSDTTQRVSVSSAGVQGFWESSSPSISADGRYVAFESLAYNFDSADTNGKVDIFVRDRQSGTTERVSISSGGVQGDGDSYSPSITADGRYVAFESFADNLVLAGDTNGSWDVFVCDRLNSTTERVSLDSGGAQGNNGSHDPSISADGRCVAFESYATNLVPGDTNVAVDVFIRDRLSGATERVSVDSVGAQGNGNSYYPSISADGRYVALESLATSLVPGDINGFTDVFIRDREATGFTSLCDPGVGGVIACPCSNPPSGSGRGCNNSFSTGGAILTASGIAYLSMDSLVFTTSGERPVALSIVLQGNALVFPGFVYGQGVRCVAGTLKRLFTKTASAGSITAPDFGGGDPTVSARSAAKGDPIQPGQSRWYLVYYRDPTVLGGCPASSTFNDTQSGHVTWSL